MLDACIGLPSDFPTRFWLTSDQFWIQIFYKLVPHVSIRLGLTDVEQIAPKVNKNSLWSVRSIISLLKNKKFFISSAIN